MRLFLIAAALCLPVYAAPAPDTAFRQETARVSAFPANVPGRPLCIAQVDDTHLYVGFTNGVRCFEAATLRPLHLPVLDAFTYPVFDIAVGDGVVALATGNGMQIINGDVVTPSLEGVFSALSISMENERMLAGGPGQLISLGNDPKVLDVSTLPKAIRALETDTTGAPWVATNMGIYRLAEDSIQQFDSGEEVISSNILDLTRDQDGGIWAAGLGGVSHYAPNAAPVHYTPAEGLPNAWVNAIAVDGAGGIWAGTNLGAARFDGARWSVRHSRRWVHDDEVVDLAPDAKEGMWVLTRGGISHIEARAMTLEEKAGYFEQVSDARHVREPGLVEKIQLRKPNDLSDWFPEDDDNDGEYTSQYVAAQAFRWAATQDVDAREKARRSFKALMFLQEVTSTSGFIARTVIPVDWQEIHDLNTTYTREELTRLAVEEPRYKAVEERWRVSADGKWKWKGDTSSDEMTGHYYAFGIYYDLVCDDTDRAQVQDHVARVTDYLIEGDYNLRDTDGKPTRWGVWSPKQLNHDPDWAMERGINSLELLGYLLTAWHVTGEERFREHYMKLITEHGYAENARNAKNYLPAWITHIDDSLLVCMYRPLLTYEKDPALLAIYRESLEHWFKGIRNEQNPWFNYSHALYGGKEEQRDDSLFFLRDTPLDLIEYSISNADREDIKIVRSPILEDRQTSRILPPSERPTIRWDKNPWRIADGTGGTKELAPTFWLLAYWMGRYGGFIAAP